MSLTLMILFPSLYGGMPMNGLPQIDPFELLNNMDPKELDKLMDDLAKMSPEEIKYYEDMGKQMFKQSGYDLDEIAKSFPAQTPPPTPAKSEQKPSTQDKAKTPVDETSKKEKDSLLRMIKTLAESLASIRQKAASDETLPAHISSLQQDLDLFTAYINRLDFERHLKHFADKEFTGLKTKLRKMSSMLEELDNNFSIPELGIRKPDQKTSAYTTQMDKAVSILKEFKNYMNNAFTTDAIIVDIENLFKKHDTEALQIKKQIEEQQKKAAEQAKRLPTTNVGKFTPIPQAQARPQQQPVYGNTNRGNYPAISGGRGTMSSSQPQPQRPPVTPPSAPQRPNVPGAPKAGQKPGEAPKKGTEGELRSKDGSKEPDFAEVPLTMPERLAKIKKDLKKVNNLAAQNKTTLFKIADDIVANKASTEDELNTLYSVTKALKTTKEETAKYLADLEKDPNTTAITGNKKNLIEFYDSQLKELGEVLEKFNSITPPTAPVKEVEEATGLVGSFKKYFSAIKSPLEKRRAVL